MLMGNNLVNVCSSQPATSPCKESLELRGYTQRLVATVLGLSVQASVLTFACAA